MAAPALIKSPVTSSEPWGPAGLGSLGLTRTCHTGRRGVCVPSHGTASGDPGGAPVPQPEAAPPEEGGEVRVSPPGVGARSESVPARLGSGVGGAGGLWGSRGSPRQHLGERKRKERGGRTERTGGREKIGGKGKNRRKGSGIEALLSFGPPIPSSRDPPGPRAVEEDEEKKPLTPHSGPSRRG